jgi:DNA polymerase-3 subunit epsilon
MPFPRLTRPLAIFDIESTGINRQTDRIIDLAILVLHPDGRRETFEFRVNPERRIPPESTAIHGITDADVKDAKPFKDQAKAIARAFDGCDLAGYNLLYFDIPILQQEFQRAKHPWEVVGRRILDAQRIYHKREPRDLAAALRFYAGESHEGAHNALADVLATAKVIEGQFAKYPDLPQDLDALHDYCNPRDPSWADQFGRLKQENGKIVINFGKFQGKALEDLARSEPQFLQWILRGDFPADTKDFVRDALKGGERESRKFGPSLDIPDISSRSK